MRLLLLGNEAIAYGALSGGVAVATAYPGTPSTEIIETLEEFKDDLSTGLLTRR
jgi:indolepyruvate ferredoxin oxidoreductase alpha subunit